MDFFAEMLRCFALLRLAPNPWGRRLDKRAICASDANRARFPPWHTTTMDAAIGKILASHFHSVGCEENDACSILATSPTIAKSICRPARHIPCRCPQYREQSRALPLNVKVQLGRLGMFDG